MVDSKANSVAIIGEVRNAGHVLLSAHNDHLLDVLASAGGPTKAPADLMVVVSRGDRFARAPLSVILADPAQNIRLAPLDQIRGAQSGAQIQHLRRPGTDRPDAYRG